MSRYTTKQGDMLDQVCADQLGDVAHLAAVLEANPGLAALGPVYPAGVVIILPDVATPVQTGTIRLWGGA